MNQTAQLASKPGSWMPIPNDAALVTKKREMRLQGQKLEPHDPKMWLDEARVMAAQCWCDETTSSREMDPVLAEVIAWKIAAWMGTAAFHAKNEEYWRERCIRAEANL
jgi:hypothetical protein